MNLLTKYCSNWKYSYFINFRRKITFPRFYSTQNDSRIVDLYRTQGHLYSKLSPFRQNEVYYSPDFDSPNTQLVKNLRESYCGTLTSDLSYLPNRSRLFIANQIENYKEPDVIAQQDVLKLMIQSQFLDEFLAIKFPTLKRYGLEGAESMLAFFYQIFELAQGHQSVDIAMTHRGRLNLLINLLNVPPALIFKKIRGGDELSSAADNYIGDVLSHIYTNTTIKNLNVNLLPNPSHLEIVNPVSMGYTRAAEVTSKLNCLNIQVHGDAAFSGQGINQESLMLSKLPGFKVNGTIHLIVNNEVGFTTPGEIGRSSLYSSNLAKIIDAPVLHCNALDPKQVMRATEIAYNYYREFNEDIFIDLHGIRVRGHNELDDPTMTNPVMYKRVHELQNQLTQHYVQSLNEKCEVDKILTEYKILNEQLNVEITAPVVADNQWKGKSERKKQVTTWDTGFPEYYLKEIIKWSVAVPENFTVHQRILETFVKTRLLQSAADNNEKIIDWATAEAMAFGSLLLQKFNIRISGQDVGRGTFAQRHAELTDQKTNEKFSPLNKIPLENVGNLEVVNSLLSEEAVLAFEYGFSIRNKRTLVLWEAQFGDFFNTAQTVIDTFISSGESKWGIPSALTLLLPHGNDGAGPEHSSSRVERFLQLCSSHEEEPDGDLVNMFVVWPSTPSQYFHILRQQMIRDVQIPLIIITPKTLLRHPQAKSSIVDFLPGTNYQHILHDDHTNNPKITKIVFTSGQLAYELKNKKPDNVAVCSIETFCPFPTKEIQTFVAQFPNATKFTWCQEEARNQGAWGFFKERMVKKLGIQLEYVGRPELATPAYGLSRLHKKSKEDILNKVFN